MIHIGMSIETVANKIALGEKFTVRKNGKEYPLELNSQGFLVFDKGDGDYSFYGSDGCIIAEGKNNE